MAEVDRIGLAALKRGLLELAHEQGFELAGIAGSEPAATRDHFFRWAGEGMAGEMGYLVRDPPRRADPVLVWPQTQSILVTGLNYRGRDGETVDRTDPLRGQVARYAEGDDYHAVIETRLKLLLARAQAELDPELQGRIYVDHGPLLERDLASRAGLGWWGKNSCTLNRVQGSYFFLGALLLNRALPPDGPVSAHCGSCRQCLDACPTDAFVGPYVLDARRCISYLTIELKGPIPRELRPLMGNWIFGCDICQEVCPWNRKAAFTSDPAMQPRRGLPAPELFPLLRMTREEFAERFRRHPIKRARWEGFLRNVCVALGNSGAPEAIDPLEKAIRHQEPLVRGHAAWALGRLGAGRAAAAAAAGELDPWVREEMELAGR